MKLRPVTPEDHLAVSVLLDTVFGGPENVRLVQRLRQEEDMALELVVDSPLGGGISGYIAFTRLVAPEDWWLLSLVAVQLRDQGKGLAGEIIRYGLDRARQDRAQAVVVSANRRYFRRFGFSEAAAAQLIARDPIAPSDRVLLYPIAPGTSGRRTMLVYPPALDRR